METKIVLRNENLWERIQGFSLDAENASFSFSKKLAKEENWTSDFTVKAIEEYKKFVYLCCILPNGASPSETVDKVWHMHLIYTQNYWEEFCPNILKRKLHHHPSKGGFNEKIKHQDWFQDTLISYQQIFKENAPEEIWLPKKEEQKNRKFWLNGFKIFSVISLVCILSSCSDHLGGLLSTLFIVIPLMFLVISVVSKIFSQNNDPKNKKDGGDNSFDGGSDGSSSCSSSCGSSCGGGCGGCGGGGD